MASEAQSPHEPPAEIGGGEAATEEVAAGDAAALSEVVESPDANAADEAGERKRADAQLTHAWFSSSNMVASAAGTPISEQVIGSSQLGSAEEGTLIAAADHHEAAVDSTKGEGEEHEDHTPLASSPAALSAANGDSQRRPEAGVQRQGSLRHSLPPPVDMDLVNEETERAMQELDMEKIAAASTNSQKTSPSGSASATPTSVSSNESKRRRTSISQQAEILSRQLAIQNEYVH